MPLSDWTARLSLRSLFCSPPRSRKPASARPRLEQLEDRLTPAVLDLTTQGAVGVAAGGIFAQNATQPAGSGVLHSFVRLQAHNGDGGVAQGYNTDARPLQFDEKTSATFTHALALGDVPTVTIGGTTYREFLLDINQTNSQPLLSLDALKLYSANSPNLTGYDPGTGQLAGLSPVFDLADNWIKLNSGLAPGSGIANMVALIPDSAFAGGSYVYLYSQFGGHENLAAHGGYEEWATSSVVVTVPVATLSGTVVNQQGTPLSSNVLLTLTNTSTGYTQTVPVNPDGTFSFTGLPPGTYTLTEQTSTPVKPSSATAGTDNGKPDGTVVSSTEIDQIKLSGGDNATGYTFVDTFTGGGA